MNNFFSYSIKLLFGTKACDQLPQDLKFSGCSRTILIFEKSLCGKKKNRALSSFAYSLLQVMAKISISSNQKIDKNLLLSSIKTLKADSVVIFSSSLLLSTLMEIFTAANNTNFNGRPITVSWVPTSTVDLDSFLKLTKLLKTINANQNASGFQFYLMAIDPIFSSSKPQLRKESARTAYFLAHQLQKAKSDFNEFEKPFLAAALKLSNYAIAKPFYSNKSLLLAHQAFYFLLSLLINNEIKFSASALSECKNFLTIKNQKIPKEELELIPTPTFYEFYSPVCVHYQDNSLLSIPDYLLKVGAKRPFVLVTRSIYTSELYKKLVKQFDKDIQIAYEATDVPQDSDVECVESLAEKYILNGCDSIIAIGGGTVIDTAKGINILATHKYGKLKDFAGSFTISQKLNPLIVVPTTSGTGSEATIVSVIADKKANKKMLFLSWYLLPSVALLDSQITLSLPPYLSAATGLDALSHAIEAIVSTAMNNASHELALSAILKIFKNLPVVLKNPKDKKARLEMAVASTLAGIAFSNSMVGLVHSLAHATGAITHIPHGNLIAIFLPYGLEYNLHKIYPMLSEIYKNLHPELFKPNNLVDNAVAFIDELKEFTNQINQLLGGNFPCCLKDVKTKDGKAAMSFSQIPKIAALTINDGSIFYSQEQVSLDEATHILEVAWDRSELDHSILLKGHQR